METIDFHKSKQFTDITISEVALKAKINRKVISELAKQIIEEIILPELPQ